MYVLWRYDSSKDRCNLGNTLYGEGVVDLSATTTFKSGYIKFRIFLTSRAFTQEMKCRLHVIGVRIRIIYEIETRPLLADVGLQFGSTEMQNADGCVSLKYIQTSEDMKKLIRVEPVTTDIWSSVPSWYRHVTRKTSDDYVKKCMEIRVEGRRFVAILTKKWL